MLLALNQFLPSSVDGYGNGPIQRDWQTLANFTGVTLSQNAVPTGLVNLATNNFYYETFELPGNYARGAGDQLRIPPVTGFQILTVVAQGYAPNASCDWTLDKQVNGNWVNIAQGLNIGSHIDGSLIWYDVIFDEPVALTTNDLDLAYRIGVRGRIINDPIVDLVVDYDDVNHTVTINSEIIDVEPLVPFLPTPVVYDSNEGILVYDTDINQVTFSHQFGLDYLWYTSPNPLAGSQAYGGFPSMPIDDTSFAFRLLSDSADEGLDHLGSPYRSVVVESPTDALTTFDTQLQDYAFWFSKPNPSKFAIESLYFDVSHSDNQFASVIDRIMIDPITPGVWFNVYYSSEGHPATSIAQWENKLWQHVPQSFRMTKKETHVLPRPIFAKYICLEFCHLKAQPYDPGQFAPPQIYKKHPQWVLNHYLGNTPRLTEDNFIGQNINIIYDLLSLAYNPYTTDLTPSPTYIGDQLSAPRTISRPNQNTTNQVDAQSLGAVNQSLNIFTTAPAFSVNRDTLLGSQALSLAEAPASYPVENLTVATGGDTSVVSSLDRQAVLDQKNFPVMSFYITCRHQYRLVRANYNHNKAYFAGIRGLAFNRDRYNVRYDGDLYIETTNDNNNVMVNDFQTIDGLWQESND